MGGGMTKRHLIQVYREAARMVAQDEWEYSCQAIKQAVTTPPSKYAYDLPEGILYRRTTGISWYDAFNWNVYDNRQQVRVLLLCLMCEWIRTDYQP